MGSLTLPIDQPATSLNADGTAFEVTSPLDSTAIAGRAGGGLGAGIWGQLGGIYQPGGAGGVTADTGGVVGTTNVQNEPGVSGTSQSGPGVRGISGTSAGVQGIGVAGAGVWGQGSPAGLFESSNGTCVEAVGTGDIDAILATTTSPDHAAVSGHNNGGGFGLWAASTNTAGQGGIGVYAIGAKYAALFDGALHVNGIITGEGCIVDGVHLLSAIQALQQSVKALQQTVQQLQQQVSGLMGGGGEDAQIQQIEQVVGGLETDVEELQGEVAALEGGAP